MIWLEIVGEKGSGQVFPIPEDPDYGYGYVDIGRCSTCTAFLHSPTVAKHHAMFVVRQGRFLFCYRLNRGYRTLVNGRAAVPPFGLLDGDEIQVGEFLLRFRAR